MPKQTRRHKRRRDRRRRTQHRRTQHRRGGAWNRNDLIEELVRRGIYIKGPKKSAESMFVGVTRMQGNKPTPAYYTYIVNLAEKFYNQLNSGYEQTVAALDELVQLSPETLSFQATKLVDELELLRVGVHDSHSGLILARTSFMEGNYTLAAKEDRTIGEYVNHFKRLEEKINKAISKYTPYAVEPERVRGVSNMSNNVLSGNIELSF